MCAHAHRWRYTQYSLAVGLERPENDPKLSDGDINSGPPQEMLLLELEQGKDT